MQALVIGGTGPTGHYMVNGLLERGYRVSMLHSGKREIPEIPDDVEHLHADAYDAVALEQTLHGRSFDLCIANYGRLRAISKLLAGRSERFMSIGGVPAYKGLMNPALFEPAGIRIPIPETSPLVDEVGQDEKGWRIVRTEESVFEHHPTATHFRYPQVYGRYQMLPREWCVVRRILDGRRQIILPEDGLTLHHLGYAENLAHAVMLAVDQPDRAAGEIFNCADDEVFTLRQSVEIIAKALDAELEIVSMPWELATPARPLIGLPLPTHRVFDISKLKNLLGYRDKVPPAEALAITARDLAENPPARGSVPDLSVTDPFDYAAEDSLIAAWRDALSRMPDIRFETEPGLTLGYSGPGGRERSKKSFE